MSPMLVQNGQIPVRVQGQQGNGRAGDSLHFWQRTAESPCGSRAGEALAGVADSVREQQSPERACARERGRGLVARSATPRRSRGRTRPITAQR